MMEDREGPRAVTVYDCLGCKWHSRRVYEVFMGVESHCHTCDHPRAPELTRATVALHCKEVDGAFVPTQTVGFIGESPRTPGWCPVLQEKAQDA